ncbi:hypothetical protein [Flavobacterium panacagri]|uniref:hypothetical protein n=1 Tax=Flavobacterium panacagri TaxID=3034146 RepID=UPI0025A61CA6|nr:hypothetical protein [Flavobacterium panacagri]
MNLDEIKNLYHELQKSYDEVKVEDLIDEISVVHDLETLEFHYSVLKNQENKRLFYDLRGCFDKHAEIGKEFLFSKIQIEKDADLKAESLFLLGTMNCKEVKPIAIDFLKGNTFKEKQYGILVMGWLGKSEDISILENEMLNNPDAELSVCSVMALRQIFFNHSKLKEKILSSYYKALKQETSNEVIINIIACVQDLLKKNFGIKELKNGNISGDAILAKEKVLQFIAKQPKD